MNPLSVTATPHTFLALLNVPPFLPTQIFFATTCLGTFAAVWIWTHFRERSLWKGPVRAAALVNLWMALTITLFTVSGLVNPLVRFQPLIHMLEEIGTMGAFCIISWHVAESLPNVVNRRLTRFVLKSSPVVFAVFWVTAATLGARHPFPMTGILLDLSPHAFAYRAALLLPGLFYTGMFSVLISEAYLIAKAEAADPPVQRRLTYFAVGSFLFFASCADHLAWSYVQSFASGETIELLAAPQIVAENVLWVLTGFAWVSGITVPYAQGSSTDRRISVHKQLTRDIREVKTELIAGPSRRVPGRRTAVGHLRRAAEILGLRSHEVGRAEKVLEVVAAVANEEGNLSRDKVLSMAETHESLMKELPESSPEKQKLREDPLPAALRPATLLTAREPGRHLGLTPSWVQLACVAACDLRILPPHLTSCLDQRVLHAYNAAKNQGSERTFLRD
jgi:hypothetical protein